MLKNTIFRQPLSNVFDARFNRPDHHRDACERDVHYLRFQAFNLLVVSHRRQQLEFGKCVLDIPVEANWLRIREDKWRTRVQISRERYLELLDIACQASAQAIGREFYNLPYEPYAPVRQQVLNLLRLVNKRRQSAALARLPTSVISYQRRIVRRFDAADLTANE